MEFFPTNELIAVITTFTAVIYILLHFAQIVKLISNFYALLSSSLNLSAIIAINSLFVGLPLLAETV